MFSCLIRIIRQRQKFSIKAVGDGYYKIQCEATGKVLDVSDGSMASGTNVQQFSWNGSAKDSVGNL